MREIMQALRQKRESIINIDKGYWDIEDTR
jgi:hypothetical protein